MLVEAPWLFSDCVRLCGDGLLVDNQFELSKNRFLWKKGIYRHLFTSLTV